MLIPDKLSVPAAVNATELVPIDPVVILLIVGPVVSLVKVAVLLPVDSIPLPSCMYAITV